MTMSEPVFPADQGAGPPPVVGTARKPPRSHAFWKPAIVLHTACHHETGSASTPPHVTIPVYVFGTNNMPGAFVTEDGAET